MKYSEIYGDKIGCNSKEEVFAYLIDNLNESIRHWDFFVNWKKVTGNIKDFEIDLNILNYLIGKNNIEQELIYLLKKYPRVVRLIPALLACRDKEFRILTDFRGGALQYEDFSFAVKNKLSDDEIKKVVKFSRDSGLLKLFEDKKIKNIVDYTLGVEVGLDSNGRKNRGGTTMETIVESFVKKLCSNGRLSYIEQASKEKVFDKWKLHLSVDKTSRRFDFAIYNGKKLYLIEANYYGGGGSKLKATAGEYKALSDFIKKDGHRFIWITDGQGWKTTKRPLEETFNHIDYLLNLKMLTEGLLDGIIINNL